MKIHAKALVACLLAAVLLSDPCLAGSSQAVLADSGKSDYIIVLPEAPHETERFAAQELQRYISRMAGVEIPVQNAHHPHRGPKILVGRTVAALESQIVPGAENSEDDQYRIHSNGTDLFLAGSRPRGTLYAVYDLLERLGARWFAPGYRFYKGMHEQVPRQSRLALKLPLDVSEVPAFRFRQEFVEHYYVHEPDDVVALIDWAAKNRINMIAVRVNELSQPWYRVLAPETSRRDLMLAAEGHGFERFLSRSDYYHEHPEWFGPVGGRPSDHYFDQFRLTHPEALATYEQNLRNFLVDFPALYSLAIIPNDSPRWTDPDLEQYSSPELLRKTYELAAKVISEVSPNTKMSIYLGVSYFGSDGMEIWSPPGVSVIWRTAVLRRTQKFPWNDPGNELNAAQYSKAAEVTRILRSKEQDVVWSSRYAPFRDISLPGLIYAEQMAAELRDLKALGGAGVDFNYAIPPAWISYELKHLLFARLTWNVNESVDQLMKTYYRDRFPGSHTAIEAFYTLLRRAMERYPHPGGGYTREDAYGLYPAEEFDKAFAEFDEARTQLERAMRESNDEREQQLIWLLGASLEYGRRKLSIDSLAQTGRMEEAAREAADMMDYAEHWSDRGVVYDSSFLRMRLERRFLGPWRNLPIKGLPPDNNRVYEFKEYTGPRDAGKPQPEDPEHLEKMGREEKKPNANHE